MSRRKRKQKAAARSQQQTGSAKKIGANGESSDLPIDPPRPNRRLLIVSSLLLLGWLGFLLYAALSR